MGLDITIKTEKHEIDFRKHNYLFRWVGRLVGEIENCEEYELDKTDIENLLADVRAVNADPTRADELLPTQEGFFFGSTQYDEWYFDKIEYAERELSKMVADMEDDETATFWAWW